MSPPEQAAGVMNFAQAGGEVEPGEEVIRKEGLSEPHRPLACRTFEANTGQIDLDVRLRFQMRRRNVLVLGLRAKAEPGGPRREGSGGTIHGVETLSGLHLTLPGRL